MQKLNGNSKNQERIQPAQTLKYISFFGLGALSWLGFSYLFVLSVKIPKGPSIYDFPWSWDAPIWNFGFSIIGALLIISVRRALGLLTEKSKNIFRDFVILISLIPIIALINTAFSILVLNATSSGGERPIEWDWVMGFLQEIFSQTFVAMTCIGYFYLTLVNKTKEKLAVAQRARTEMELKTLQQNIEPHFLFNNLNVLSSLIESNPARANEFLSKMSEIYRYILQSQTAEFVPLKDEIEFAKDYIYLLKERFGAAYNFDWQIHEESLDEHMIVPVSLQSLIENAVKHNAGNPENPLQIAVKLENEYLTVENEMRIKILTFQTNKSGLANLRNRYLYLTEKPLEITQNDSFFKVRLPLLHAE